jgi:WD40 repeat protein
VAADRESRGDGATGADVFVSYSRVDEAFVRRLDAALRERGKDTWIDWDDIPPTADWQARIFTGIEASRAFVSVLSPDLLASAVCAEELAHATASNKRVVPLLYRQIERAGAPEALIAPNWISLRDGDDFERAVDTLVEALETDLAWLDAHARLLVRATEWERLGRDSSYLLRGRDLNEAESWLAEQGSHTEAATPLQADYIVASRRGSARRQRLVLGGVGVALAISIVLGVVAFLQRNAARHQAEISRSRELAATAVTQLDGDPELSLLLAREGVDVQTTPQADDALRRALRASHLRLTMRTGRATSARFSPDGSRIVAVVGRKPTVRDARTGHVLARLRGHRAAVHEARWSRDGTRIVTASADRTARVWDARTGSPVAVMRVSRGDVTDAAFSPDGRQVLTAGGFRPSVLWNGRTGRPIVVLRDDDGIDGAVFSADGRRVATASHGGHVAVWDARTGGRLFRAKGDDTGEHVYSPSFSPDGKLLINAGPSYLRVWNARSGRLVKTLYAHEAGAIEVYVSSAQFSDNGWYAVTAGADGTAIVWAVPAWTQVAVLRGHAGGVRSAEFSPDTRRVVTLGEDGARVWDTVTGAAIAVLRVPGVRLESAHFAPDGNRVVTAGEDGVRVWEASGFVPVASVRPPGGPPPNTEYYVNDAVFSPDGRTFATRTERPPIDLWSVATGRRVLRLPGHGPAKDWPEHLPRALAFSRDGSRIVSIADDAGIVWDTRSGARVSRLRRRPVERAAFTPDGRSLVTTGPDAWARVWDAASGRLRRSLKLSDRNSPTDAFSPDGSHYAGWDGHQVAVWDVATGNRVATLAGKLDGLYSPVVFSPDGTRVYVDALDGTRSDDPAASRAGIWDAATGKVVSVFRARGHVREASFSADGRLVITRDFDTAEVWDAQTGERLATMRGHGASNAGSLSSASFSPDGTLVLTAGADGTAKVWDARTGELVATLRQTPQVEGYSVPSSHFSPDGRRLLVVDAHEVNVYRCEECGTQAELVRLADSRLARGATDADRERLEHLAG